MDLRDQLIRRLKTVDESVVEAMVHVIQTYEISINIKNLITGDLILFDKKNRKISFSDTTLRSGLVDVNSVNPDCEIIICISKGSILGWVKVSDLKDSYVSLKNLNALPSGDFDLTQECSHLPDCGGITTDYRNWICLGCGKELVFSDKKR